MTTMTGDEMVRLCREHTLYSWNKGSAVVPVPVARAKGSWFETPEGHRLLDFNSQAMSVNVGHGHPRIIAAMKAQLDELPYAWPASATAVRARLGKLLSEIVPGDIDTFFFTMSGAEANENAIKAARLYTGRHKILSRYRSYHGATHGAASMTGDPRRWAVEPGAAGFVKVMDPRPYDYSFGDTGAEQTRNNLTYLEEVIQYEGPDQIAAMCIETVPGTNGVLPPPEGYLTGLRELLDRYGILLICDEVMTGFGRTGKLFAIEHSGVLPDILTMAKGLTSSYAPLGCMGLRPQLARHFEDNVFWGGLTYNAHPLCLSAAEANIHVLLDEGMVENAARMGHVMREEMDGLVARHPSVKEGRCIGLLGMVDLQRNAAGAPFVGYNEKSPLLKAFQHRLVDDGLFTYLHWASFTTIPPLCITEEELRHGFSIIDRNLAMVDAAFEG